MKPNDLPIAKKHKSVDSDEDDEEPQNEPGTSSTSQPFVPALPLNQRPAASSQAPILMTKTVSIAISTVHEVRTLEGHYPDLYILTNDEHWTVTPETHKYAAAAGSFCFVTTETSDQQDINNLTTVPSVQRSLCLTEVTDNSVAHKLNSQKDLTIKPETCWNVAWQPVEKPHQQEPKCGLVHEKKASTQEVRGYYKQFAEAKHIEWTSWIDNDVFDLVEFQTEELHNRSMGTYHQNRQAGRLPQGKGEMGTEKFPGQTKGVPANGLSFFQ